MKTSYFILFVFVITFCTSFKDKKDNHVDYLNILQVKNKSLLPILDYIISQEKHCVYYKPELIFEVDVRKNISFVELHIKAAGAKVAKSEWEKGCIQYGEHLFIVYGFDEGYKTIFKNTKKKMSISSNIYITLKDGEFLEEDNTFSTWVYHYANDVFEFKKLYDFFCKSLSPIGDRDARCNEE
jgi:hypothetical protein